MSETESKPAKVKAKGETIDSRITALEAELIELRTQRRGAKDAGPLESITIDVPKFSDAVVINNVHYQYGHTYQVPKDVATSIRDIMARAWEHEDQTHGEGRHVTGILIRRPANRRIRGF